MGGKNYEKTNVFIAVMETKTLKNKWFSFLFSNLGSLENPLGGPHGIRHWAGIGPASGGTEQAPGAEKVDFTHVFISKRRLGHICRQPAVPQVAGATRLRLESSGPIPIVVLAKLIFKPVISHGFRGAPIGERL